MWPRLATYLGAKATSQQHFEKSRPDEGDIQLEFSMAECAQDKRQIWNELCDRQGRPKAKATFDFATWKVVDWVFQRTWSATLSINKARKYGWTGHMDSYQSFVDLFEEYRKRGMLPQ